MSTRGTSHPIMAMYGIHPRMKKGVAVSMVVLMVCLNSFLAPKRSAKTCQKKATKNTPTSEMKKRA